LILIIIEGGRGDFDSKVVIICNADRKDLEKWGL